MTKLSTSAVGKLEPRQITRELEEAYLDYAMSVIVSRALPDVRDGLKPVHRRILYAMWSLGLRPGTKYRKSATVVGEVLGKYHPHGDVAVYDALARLAQSFSMRYPLIDGQGNFGSVDGDQPAAMRYTEVRLARISEELLLDLDKDTVDFRPNYDESQTEPSLLPANLPNLLLNGTVGIAVGMATNIPPHNLREISEATIALAKNPKATVDDLLAHVKGPDFPTGGIIYNREDIRQAYATGKGAIVTRGHAEIEDQDNGEFSIVVTSIPYQVNKAQLIEKIAELVKDKRIEGVKDIRDESDKQGLRIVIDLRKDSYPRKVLNRLYTHTQLQETFHVNLLALIENGLQPQVLSLKTILEEYLSHRQLVVRRRTQYELTRAEERAHILEGLKKALAHLDAVIKLIKASKDKDDARVKLMKRFGFTERQAVAILDMRLHQLANLERQKILDELKDLITKIKEYKAILASPKRVLTLVTDELRELTTRYGDDRRTEVVDTAVDSFKQEDLIPNEPTIVAMTHDGYIKRTDPKIYRTQGRGGKGVIGLTTKEKDAVEHFFSTETHADLLFFTTTGRVFQMKAYDLPVASRTAKGQAIVNYLQLGSEEKISAIVPRTAAAEYLVMVTRSGVAKRVKMGEFENVRRSGLIAIRLRKSDLLDWVLLTDGKTDLILVTDNAQSIRFPERQLRPMGRNAAGVRAIRLKGHDIVVGAGAIPATLKQQGKLLVVTDRGFGKLTGLTQYRLQSRAGSGIKTAKVTAKTGKIAVAHVIDPTADRIDLVIISQKGQVIRTPLANVSELGRATQGVRVMRFSDADDAIASATII